MPTLDAVSILDDVRGALRQLRSAPGRSGAIVLILAVGLGLNTALFAIVHSLQSRPAPGIPSNERLVRIRGTVHSVGADRIFSRSLRLAEFQALAAEGDVFTRVVASTDRDALVAVSPESEPVLATLAFVTPGWFETLGVRPVLGRSLATTPPNGGPGPEAVVSHALWTELFGNDPSVIGRSLRIDDTSVTVVGVAPSGFRGTDRDGRLRMAWMGLPPGGTLALPRSGGGVPVDSVALSVVAKLAPGTTPGRAEAVARAVSARVGEVAASERFRDPSADVVPLLAFNARPTQGTDTALAAVGALALIVLLIVGANVSVLLAGAGVTRRREISVRLSLGASRSRIIRQLLVESVLLSATGAVLGLGILLAAVDVIDARLLQETLVVDWPTVAVCTALALLTGVLSGLSPALHATRVSLSQAMAGGPGAAPPARLALQRRLVVLQIAVTQPLLLGIAVLVSFLAADAHGATASPVGRRVLVVEMNRIGGDADAEEIGAEMRQLHRALADRPDVAEVIWQPGGFRNGRYAVQGADRGQGRSSYAFDAREIATAPGYFGLVEIPLVRGRGFREGDRDVVVVGSDLARILWGQADPLGRRILKDASGPEARELTVVGVVDSDRSQSPGPGEAVWVPADHGSGYGSVFHSVYVRTHGSAEASVPAVSTLTRRLAPSLTLESVQTLEASEAESRRARLTVAGTAAAGGLLALILASVGLWASIALAVRQRTHEIGVRIALGARGAAVEWLFVRGGLGMALLGIGLGLPLSVAVLRWYLSAFPVPDLFLGTAVALAVLGVTTLATWLPARRAARVHPMATLRTE